MFGNLGFGEILLIALIALLLFGPAKLPELGRALGRTLREFKQGARDLMGDDQEASPPPPPRKDVTPPPPRAASEEPVQPAASSQPQPAEKPASDSRRLPD